MGSYMFPSTFGPTLHCSYYTFIDLNDIIETHIWLLCPVFGIFYRSLFTLGAALLEGSHQHNFLHILLLQHGSMKCVPPSAVLGQNVSCVHFQLRSVSERSACSCLCGKVEVGIGFRFGLGRELDNN